MKKEEEEGSGSDESGEGSSSDDSSEEEVNMSYESDDKFHNEGKRWEDKGKSGKPSKKKQGLQERQKKFEEIALKIWEYAEVGYKELQSSSLLQKSLQDSGFKVKNNLAGMPTAFVAEYGNGYPIIGILGLVKECLLTEKFKKIK